MNTRTCTRLVSLLLLALLAYVPATYAAGSATAQFNVTATVGQICSVTANPLAFGDYTNTRDDAVTTVTVNCANGTHWNVKLSDGSYYSGGTRKMKHAGSNDYLEYNLFSDDLRNVLWNSTQFVSGASLGLPQPLTVYGRVHGGQPGLPTGDYADVINVTVEY